MAWSKYIAGALLFCVVATSQSAEIISLGNAIPHGVSADGLVVVGDVPFNVSNTEAFKWTATTGVVGLGTFGGYYTSRGVGVSDDGGVVVGHAYNPSGESYRWTENSGFQGIGSLPSDCCNHQSVTGDISANGNVVVGFSQSTSAAGHEAYGWSEEDGMTGLGHLPGSTLYSSANGVSTDGSVIVGKSTSGDALGADEAFRWTEDSGMVGLGFLSSRSSPTSEAMAVSSDGSVIVGGSRSGSSDYEAFRWTEETGMVGLGFLDQDALSVATDVSADGNTIVGHSGNNPNTAFIWTPQGGMHNLKELLIMQGVTGIDQWRLDNAFAVSADGSTIVGSGYLDSGYGGWIATIDVAPVPVPAAAYLFASALGLLGCMRCRA